MTIRELKDYLDTLGPEYDDRPVLIKISEEWEEEANDNAVLKLNNYECENSTNSTHIRTIRFEEPKY